jgi:hypothetical protein
MITQLNPRNLGPAVRATNERLMMAFVQADLPSRVGLDAREIHRPLRRKFPVQLRAG